MSNKIQLIHIQGQKQIFSLNYDQVNELEMPFGLKPFVCVIWNNNPEFVSTFLVEKLLKSNCKYFVCAGIDCDLLEETIDEIDVKRNIDNNKSKVEYVMTTSHKDEDLNEVIDFALNCTNFDNYEFDKYLIIQIGEKFTEKDIQEIIQK